MKRNISLLISSMIKDTVSCKLQREPLDEWLLRQDNSDEIIKQSKAIQRFTTYAKHYQSKNCYITYTEAEMILFFTIAFNSFLISETAKSVEVYKIPSRMLAARLLNAILYAPDDDVVLPPIHHLMQV